ncbi:hypothetical protein [Knoellia sp. p5-6-4]|uniref:hypothetical protein n=1 Tax=unclassified Knoellia TaxID=2618719 RepID=UPI0023DB6BBF|nr:hypothetical protein [Knoellia sp. p5-6-4]MDF2146360.1 hypothetical protein [Knoellia sp. p5-6-4]
MGRRTPPRGYVVGLPVTIGVFPDGRVVVDVDLSDAADAIAEEGEGLPISGYTDDQVHADSLAVARAVAGQAPMKIKSSSPSLLHGLLRGHRPRHLTVAEEP